MGSKALTSKFSTVAVIVFAIGIALLQGKAFAKSNEAELPAGSSQSTQEPITSPSSGSTGVQTINLPGAGQGGEDDGEGEGYEGEDDDNFGED